MPSSPLPPPSPPGFPQVLPKPTIQVSKQMTTLERTRSIEEEPKQNSGNSGLMSKLFKSSKDDAAAKAKEESKKKEKNFDDFLKSDKTVKLVLKDGASTKKDAPTDNHPKDTKDAPPTPKVLMRRPSGPVEASPLLDDGSFEARRLKRRSQTMSDLRSWNTLQGHAAKSAKIIAWFEQVLGDVFLEEDLATLIVSGDLLCRLIPAVQPHLKNPYEGKGSTFSLQKINFFLQTCRQLGVKERDLFSVIDLEGKNLSSIIRTFVAFSQRLKATGYLGPLLKEDENEVPLVEDEDEREIDGVFDAYNELLVTEKNYISSLRVVINYLDLIRRKQLMNRQDTQKMFSNIEEILSVHEILVKEIQENKETIGAVFLKMTHYLKIYSVYCANYPTAVSFLISKRENEQLKVFFNTFLSLEESQGLPIETFLMKPVQRICKYPLLLRQINATLPETHAGKADLLKAIETIDVVVNTVNDRRKHVENSEKIMEIEQKLIGSDKINLLAPTRRFIQEGEVFKVFTEGKLRDRHIFLFNDLLVLASPQSSKKDKYLVKLVADLDQVELVSNAQVAPIDTIEDFDPKKSERKIGIEKFNESPKKGIQYLIDEAVIENNPQSIASFLFQTPSLSRSGIGDYIGAPTNTEILNAYNRQLDVSGMRYDEALRSFLLHFRLPGEAQIIDRIVQSFAVWYCDQNPGIFPDTDIAYTLVFAMIMLNTSIHNPKVDRKMTLDDFITNFRNADQQAILSDKLLEAMYRSIKEEKLEFGADEQEQSGKIAITIKNLPSKICLGEKSQIITVSIPIPDASLRLKLQGQGIECEPNILTFAENARQTFVISPKELGQKTLVFAKMGKNAKLYAKPPPVNLLVRLPALEYNFQLSVGQVGVGKRNQEELLIGVKSQEEQRRWVAIFENVLDQLKKEKNRNRSDSAPQPSFDL